MVCHLKNLGKNWVYVLYKLLYRPAKQVLSSFVCNVVKSDYRRARFPRVLSVDTDARGWLGGARRGSLLVVHHGGKGG